MANKAPHHVDSHIHRMHQGQPHHPHNPLKMRDAAQHLKKANKLFNKTDGIHHLPKAHLSAAKHHEAVAAIAHIAGDHTSRAQSVHFAESHREAAALAEAHKQKLAEASHSSPKHAKKEASHVSPNHAKKEANHGTPEHAKEASHDTPTHAEANHRLPTHAEANHDTPKLAEKASNGTHAEGAIHDTPRLTKPSNDSLTHAEASHDSLKHAEEEAGVVSKLKKASDFLSNAADSATLSSASRIGARTAKHGLDAVKVVTLVPAAFATGALLHVQAQSQTIASQILDLNRNSIINGNSSSNIASSLAPNAAVGTVITENKTVSRNIGATANSNKKAGDVSDADDYSSADDWSTDDDDT